MIDKQIVKTVQNTIKKLISYIENSNLKKKYEKFLRDINDDFEVLKEDNYYEFLTMPTLENKKTPIDVYIETNENDLTDLEKNILVSLNQSMLSIFRVNKTTKDSFITYNLINEKEYTIKTLDNFLNYKHIGVNNYMFARIMAIENYHIIVGSVLPFPAAAKTEVLEMVIMFQLDSPYQLILDNPLKQEEIYEQNSIKYQKFYDIFNNDYIYSDCDKIYDLMASFLKYVNMGEPNKSDILNKMVKPEKFYFNIELMKEKESDDLKHNFLNNKTSISGIHDVGFLINEKEGYYILPYFATFMEIFSNPNFKEIEGYKECVLYYLDNPEISPAAFVKAISVNPINSVKVFEDVLDEEGFSIEEDFDNLMKSYKYDYVYNNQISALSLLEHSNAFKELIEILEDEAFDDEYDDDEYEENEFEERNILEVQ